MAAALTCVVATAQERAAPVQPGAEQAPKSRPMAVNPGRPRGREGQGPNFAPGLEQAQGRGNQPAGDVRPGQDPDAGPGDDEGAVLPEIRSSDGKITLAGFSEPVELPTLVALVAETLQVNMLVDPALTGEVVFNAPVEVDVDKLLALLEFFLNKHGFTITYYPEVSFYVVHPVGAQEVDLEGDEPRTRVIETPNVRPTALKPAIDVLLAGVTSAGGKSGGGGGDDNAARIMQMQQGLNPGGGGGGGGVVAGGVGGGAIAYIDELGLIIVQDTERRIRQVEALVERLLQEHGKMELLRIELKYIAAATARERALAFVGAAPQSGGQANPQNRFNPGMVEGQPQQQTQAARTTFDNLSDRLTVDPQSNALFFRGRPDEIGMISKFMQAVDKPSNLTPKNYQAGASARQMAEIARSRGLGEVQTIETQPQGRNPNPFYGPYNEYGQQQQRQDTTVRGGPVMVVDEGRGLIVYYATDDQHNEFQKLLDVIDPDDDATVIEVYKLQYNKAEEVESVLVGLIQNQTPSRGGGELTESNTPSQGGFNNSFQPSFWWDGLGYQDPSMLSEQAFVVADPENNQVFVKAPRRQQAAFERLIRKLDQRRPQVMIEARVLVVRDTDEFAYALETQLINANGTGGVLNTNFGLGGFGTGSTILDPKTVTGGSRGFTGAVIKSDMVPVVLNALKSETGARVLSAPKLMVDDNAEGTIEAQDEEPTQVRTERDTSDRDVVSAGDYAEAGTKLKIKPQIGSGNFLTLELEVELSSFGARPETLPPELPPPRNRNSIILERVQVPSGMTVIVGGVDFDSSRSSEGGIPILSDIPLIGPLLGSITETETRSRLYIFLTPRIIRDPVGEDLRILSEGPYKAAGFAPMVPPLEPVLVDTFIVPVATPTAGGGK